MPFLTPNQQRQSTEGHREANHYLNVQQIQQQLSGQYTGCDDVTDVTVIFHLDAIRQHGSATQWRFVALFEEKWISWFKNWFNSIRITWQFWQIFTILLINVASQCLQHRDHKWMWRQLHHHSLWMVSDHQYLEITKQNNQVNRWKLALDNMKCTMSSESFTADTDMPSVMA